MEAVNASYTMIGLVRSGGLCHDRAMTRRNPIAGGFLLILPIILGFAWGLVTGHAALGVLVGLAVGLVLAAAVWAIDRANARR